MLNGDKMFSNLTNVGTIDNDLQDGVGQEVMFIKRRTLSFSVPGKSWMLLLTNAGPFHLSPTWR